MRKSSPTLVVLLFESAAKVALITALLGALSTPASAQQKKPAADPAVAVALRKAQAALQQLSEQNAQLGDEVSQLRAQVAALAPKAQQLDKAERVLAQKNSSADELREQYRALVERTHRDAARIDELQQAGAKLHGDNGLLENAVTEREQWIGDCSKKNAQLRQVNAELLDKYRNKGVWQALKNVEPVTGIAAVGEERELQSYRFRLEDLAVKQATAAAGAER